MKGFKFPPLAQVAILLICLAANARDFTFITGGGTTQQKVDYWAFSFMVPWYLTYLYHWYAKVKAGHDYKTVWIFSLMAMILLIAGYLAEMYGIRRLGLICALMGVAPWDLRVLYIAAGAWCYLPFLGWFVFRIFGKEYTTMTRFVLATLLVVGYWLMRPKPQLDHEERAEATS